MRVPAVLSRCPDNFEKISDFCVFTFQKTKRKSGAWGKNKWATGQNAYINIYILEIYYII